MIRILCMLSLLVSVSAYAASLDMARELHVALNAVDRETIPKQLVFQMLQARPELRAREQELRDIVLEILNSKEYEDLRAAYFSKAYNEQQLIDQLALVRTPAFKLYQRSSVEIMQSSGATLVRLMQAKLARLDSSPKKASTQDAVSSRTTFYSEDFGSLFISSWLYLDQQTERVYRTTFSDKNFGSGHSFFMICAVRKFALTNGFNAYAYVTDPDDKQSALFGFLRKDESVEAVLGSKFAKAQVVEGDNKNIAEMCVKGAEQAKARQGQAPNPSVQGTLRDNAAQRP